MLPSLATSVLAHSGPYKRTTRVMSRHFKISLLTLLAIQAPWVAHAWQSSSHQIWKVGPSWALWLEVGTAAISWASYFAFQMHSATVARCKCSAHGTTTAV